MFGLPDLCLDLDLLLMMIPIYYGLVWLFNRIFRYDPDHIEGIERDIEKKEKKLEKEKQKLKELEAENKRRQEEINEKIYGKRDKDNDKS